jgi:acyl-coenzyme A synthetase/AMP-(fatty) acid ligase
VPAIRIEHDRQAAELFLKKGLWTDDTLPSVVERVAGSRPHHPALLTPTRSVSYADLWEASRKLAAGFVELGIIEGDVIAAQLPNIEEFVVAYVAANLIGAIFHPIHLPYRAPDLRTLLGHGGAKAFIGLSARDDCRPVDEVLALKPELPALRHVIVADGLVAGCIALADLTRCGSLVAVRSAADRPCLLLYTSGTTTHPKGVPHAHRTLMSTVAISAEEFGLSSKDVVLTLSRFSHMWGASTLLMTLRQGATSLLLPNFAPDKFARLVETLRPSFVFGAPIHLVQTFRDGLLARHDFSSIRVVATSGSVFPPDQMQAINSQLPAGQIVELWGMTEIGPAVFTRPGTPPELSLGTIGTPIPGFEMRIVTSEGRPVRDGEQGELEVQGIGVFTGYLGNAAANAASFTRDGWFRTGDLAIRDDNGRYRITGRVKEVINRGGVKLNPIEVEKTLITHPRIRACAVVPVPDSIYGERAWCCAVIEGEQPLTLEEICAYLADKDIGKGFWPERLELLDELPMTPTGKVSKGILTEMIAARTATHVETQPTAAPALRTC